MITQGSLVIYKNKHAVVTNYADGKYTVSIGNGTPVKARDKDIEVIHHGPLKGPQDLEMIDAKPEAVRETWELLIDDGAPVTLKDLASFIFNEHTPSSAYAAYRLLRDGLYFTGSVDSIVPRPKDEVEADEAKRDEKQREAGERAAFLERVKSCLKNPAPLPKEDARFMQDIEALAYGKSAKSRTLKEIGVSETPEDAHSLLLKTGFWTNAVNPHPARFGVSSSGAIVKPEPPSIEAAGACKRKDLTSLTAFAIDSPWSDDPDDAVSIVPEENLLYVHVADPAASITFDSPAEKEARDRGATLYLPEGTVRMLAEESIPMFALGLSDTSVALTFKMTINEDGEVKETEIFPSVVKVKRVTFEDADKQIETDAELRDLFELAKKIYNRRVRNGAINFDLPDVHIEVKNEEVTIEPYIEYRSSFLVKECMIAAGEGAGTWAASRGLAFPYISQEVEIQGKITDGLAGAIQLRKCMRPRVLSVKPGRHQGMGLDTYTQVTSPLRRYTDLLAHIQIYSFLRGEKPLAADEVSARLGFCEAATTATIHAERASNNHWKMVYLAGKKDSEWEAVAAENKGSRWLVLIPALAYETQVALQRNVAPNDVVTLVLKSASVAKGEAVFAHG